MKKTLLILLTVSFAWLQGAKSQVVIEGETVSMCLTPTVSIDVTATNFADMVSAQFGVTWDPAILEFSSANNHLPPSALFNTTNAASGELKFSWFDLNPPVGILFTSGDPIFTLNFNLIGSYGDVTSIDFGPLPGFPIQFVNSGGVVPASGYSLQPGSVSIEDTTPPVVNGCPLNILQTLPYGSSSAAISWTPPTATDNCSTPALTSNFSPGATFNVGPPTTVTYEAEDPAGNITPCSFTVTLLQSPNPSPLTFIAGNDTLVCSETQVSVPVTTENFENMISAQFAVVWDETILQYNSYTDLMNAQHPSAVYNTLNTANGEFRFSWFDINASIGETLGNGDTLFILHFTLISPTATLATVNFSALPGFIIQLVSTSGVISNSDIVFDNNEVLIALDEPPVISGCPLNINKFNDAGECGAVTSWIAPTAIDECDGPLALVQITGSASGSLFPVGPTVVTYRATDSQGHFSECSFTVTVTDNEDPEPLCPADLTVNTDPDLCTAVVTFTGSVNDNCPGATIAPGIASGSSFSLGLTNVTFTATDAAGNTATCNFDITVEDNEAPEISGCPLAITQDNDPDECGAIVTWTAPTAMDNCLFDALTPDIAPGSVFDVGTTTVTYTATDDAGNESTCVFTVTVEDNQSPELTGCPIAITQNNAPGECGTDVTWTAPSVSDNCPGVTLACVPASGDFFAVGTETVTCTATDAADNETVCTFTVTVVDMEDPEIMDCPGNIVQGNDTTLCEAVVDWVEPTATDNCPGVVMTSNFSPGATFAAGVTATVTYTAEDASGRTTTCSFTVTVEDSEDPVVNGCPGNIILSSGIGQCDTVATWISPVFTDNCAGMSIDSTHSSGDLFTTGTTTVTYTATDAAGNETVCSFDITIEDYENPVITGCPANIVQDIDADSCNAVVTWTVPLASDNCPGVVLSATHNPDDIFPVDTTTVTYTATDASGNQVTCSFDVIVNDTIAPVLAGCPANIMTTAGIDSCSTIVTWAMPTVSDNCSGTTITCIPPSGTEFPVGDSIVICIAEDIGGNRDTCEFMVRVADGQNPVLECIADLTVEIPVGAAPVSVNNIYLFSQGDNCGIDTTYWELTGATLGNGAGNDASGTSFNTGVTSVTYFSADAAGNTGSCTFDISVEEMLTITCPGNAVSANDADSCSVIMHGLAATVTPAVNLQELFYEITGATTGSGQDSVSGTAFNVGTSTVTYFAVSTSSDTISCSFTVQVNDEQPPIFANCWNDTIVGNTQGECGLIFDGLALPAAIDNCPGVIVNHSFPVGGLIPLGGPFTVTSQATDAAGNTAICFYELVVIDTEPPTITNCPDDFTVSSDPDTCGAVLTWPAPTADDNCQLLAFTPSDVPGTFIPVTVTGPYPIEYVAVDAIGNISKCKFKVTVTDTQPPTFQNCPGDTTIFTTADNCMPSLSWQLPVAMDNCGVTGFSSTHVSGAKFQVGTEDVVYYAVDAAGNDTTCTFTVTVMDDLPPSIVNIPADITAYATATACGATVNWPAPLFDDNCGLDSIDVSEVSGDFFDVTALGTPLVVEITATDIHGNTQVETFHISVLDTIAPVIDCPAAIVVSVNGTDIDDPSGFLTSSQTVDCQNIELSFTMPSASDTCGIASLTQTDGLPSGSVFPAGVNMITFEAKDNNGNESFCHVQIEVQDFPAPVAIASNLAPCEGDDVVLSITEYPGASYLWLDQNGNFVSLESSFTLSDVTAGNATYTGFVAFPTCDLVASVSLDVALNPAVVASANDLVCTDGSAPLVLTGNDTANAGVDFWSWEYFALNGQTASSSGPDATWSRPNATSDYSGTYVLTGVNANGCAGYDTLLVDVSDDPNVMPSLFGTSAAACADDEIVLDGESFTGMDVSYHWYAEPAAGSGLNPINNNVISVNPTALGDYKYYFYVTVDGCTTDTAEWLVNIQAPPVIEFSVDGETACVDGTTDVTLTETGGEGSSWVWKRGNTILSNTQSLVLENVTTAMSGDYTVIATTANGCESTQEYALNITEQPDAIAELFSSTSLICKDASVTLTGTPVPGATYLWTGQNLPPLSQYNSTIAVQPGQTGTFEYTFSALIQGCTTNVAAVTVEVVTDALPAITAYLENDACEDADLQFCVDLVPGAIYEWRNPAGNVFASVQCPTIPNAMLNMNGVYTVSASKDGCSAMDSILVSIPGPPLAVDEVVVGLVDTPQSFNVVVNDSLYGKNYTISVVQQPVHGQVVYDGEGVFTYTPETGFRETDRVLYEICYEDCPDACDIAMVTLLVRYETNTCVVTTVITPNQDGINDEMVVSCLELGDYPLNTLEIFNQWGDKVYDAAPYKNDWKGTYEGKDLPDGTYFYIFQRDPDVPAQKGFVMIYR